MKKFEIVATRENGTLITEFIYAASEKAALKDFNEVYRHAGKVKIDHIIDLGGGFPATKAQERAAVEEIKAIVDALGTDSYVATALHGCLDDAERNIADDAAYSMHDRWQTAQRRCEELEQKVETLEEAIISERETTAAYKCHYEELEEKVMSDDDRYDLYRLVCEKLDELDRLLKEAEAAIIENAEHPETEAFKDAVKQQRAYASSKAHYKELQKKVY